jgi:hypothetical protein
MLAAAYVPCYAMNRIVHIYCIKMIVRPIIRAQMGSTYVTGTLLHLSCLNSAWETFLMLSSMPSMVLLVRECRPALPAAHHNPVEFLGERTLH